MILENLLLLLLTLYFNLKNSYITRFQNSYDKYYIFLYLTSFSTSCYAIFPFNKYKVILVFHFQTL